MGFFVINLRPKQFDMNAQEAIRRVIRHEGGFTANPTDRGNWTTGVVNRGELRGTKFGISAMAYPTLDIMNLTERDAEAIYMRDYWNPLRLGRMTFGLAYQVLDFAVNSGSRRAAQTLQRIVEVPDDGIIGNVTLEAIRVYGQKKAAMMVIQRRLEFLTSINTFNTFGRGWVTRVADNLEYLVNDMP